MTDCTSLTGEGRKCWRRAKAAVDDKPLCTQHAAVAARKAAEAARKAAWWEEYFTPTPEEPYRGDPEWQAAKRVILADSPPGGASATLPGRAAAIFRVLEIEEAWEASAAPAATRTRGSR